MSSRPRSPRSRRPRWPSRRATLATECGTGPAHAAAARRLAAALGEEALAGAVATLGALSAALDEVSLTRA